MADLNYIDRDGEVKIVGQDATGNTVNYVSADVNGNLFVKDYADGPVTPGTAAAASTLIGGQFNATLPTLTTAQQSALQTDSRGRLIVTNITLLTEDHNYGTVGANTIRTAAQIGNATGAADFGAGTTSSQTLKVVLPTDQTAIPVTQSTNPWFIGTQDASTTGTISAINQTVSIATSGYATTTVSTTGTWAGILNFDYSNDHGATWWEGTVHEMNINGLQVPFFQFGANDAGMAEVGGWTNFRVRANAWTSGTATITLNNSFLPQPNRNWSLDSTLDTVGSIQFGYWKVGLTVPSGDMDVGYGTVGIRTLRSAAQIGNATGAAAFGAGTTSAQTLRVVLPTDQSAIPVTQSGTWTVQPGNTANTTAWFVKDNSLGTVAAGTAGTQSSLAGGVFNTALPTLTNGQQASLQLDSSGRLIIAPTTSSSIITISNLPATVDTNYGTVGANTIRTAAQIGNATGAAAFGAGTTSAQTLRAEANQGAAGSTSWLTTDLADGPVAPGTVATKSMLIGGQFNTTSPILTTGQQSALQTDFNGRLLVVSDDQDHNPATQNITVQDTASTTTAIANGQSAFTGTPTAGSAASFVLSSDETVVVEVTGTWTGTLETEISMDNGTTWFIRPIHQAGGSSAGTAGSFTANFAGGCNIGGWTNFRVRAIAAMTGTATVKVVLSLNPNSIYIANPIKLGDANNNLGVISAAGSLHVLSDSAGPVTPGTVATKSDLAGGQFNTSLPTLTNTQQSAIQLDSSGRLIIAPLTNSSVVKSQLQDNAGNGLSSQTSGSIQALDVIITTPIKTTYMAGSGSFSPPATPTDMWVMQGSGTKTIKILKIILQTTQTTPGTNTFFLKRYSTADTAGTATAVSSFPLDTTNAAATSTIKFYTANPTLGTLVGSLDSAYLTTGGLGASLQPYSWDFTNNQGQPLVLRGAADQIAINFAGAALPAGLKVAVTVMYTEE